MRLTDAANVLGMHYVSVHRLMRQKKLMKTADGVSEESVLAYLRAMTKPEGFIETRLAAARLGIPVREMAGVCNARLITCVTRPGRGWWVLEADVEELHQRPEKLAMLGMKLPPPEGWLTRDQATARMHCSSSWLARLARRGLIRRRLFGRHYSWYMAEDIDSFLAHSSDLV